MYFWFKQRVHPFPLQPFKAWLALRGLLLRVADRYHLERWRQHVPTALFGLYLEASFGIFLSTRHIWSKKGLVYFSLTVEQHEQKPGKERNLLVIRKLGKTSAFSSWLFYCEIVGKTKQSATCFGSAWIFVTDVLMKQQHIFYAIDTLSAVSFTPVSASCVPCWVCCGSPSPVALEETVNADRGQTLLVSSSICLFGFLK